MTFQKYYKMVPLFSFKCNLDNGEERAGSEAKAKQLQTKKPKAFSIFEDWKLEACSCLRPSPRAIGSDSF